MKKKQQPDFESKFPIAAYAANVTIFSCFLFFLQVT